MNPDKVTEIDVNGQPLAVLEVSHVYAGGGVKAGGDRWNKGGSAHGTSGASTGNSIRAYVSGDEQAVANAKVLRAICLEARISQWDRVLDVPSLLQLLGRRMAAANADKSNAEARIYSLERLIARANALGQP